MLVNNRLNPISAPGLLWIPSICLFALFTPAGRGKHETMLKASSTADPARHFHECKAAFHFKFYYYVAFRAYDQMAFAIS